MDFFFFLLKDIHGAFFHGHHLHGVLRLELDMIMMMEYFYCFSIRVCRRLSSLKTVMVLAGPAF